MTDNTIPLFFFSSYESLSRQGPGDDTITRSLRADIADLSDKTDVIDTGFRTGAQTLFLADRGGVTAVNFHQPSLMEPCKTRWIPSGF